MLTYVLRALEDAGCNQHLAFKGGSYLRKAVFSKGPWRGRLRAAFYPDIRLETFFSDKDMMRGDLTPRAKTLAARNDYGERSPIDAPLVLGGWHHRDSVDFH